MQTIGRIWCAYGNPPPLITPPRQDAGSGQSCLAAGTSLGNPIIPATGEKILDQIDFTDAASHGINFSRHFRSSRVVGIATGPAGAGLGSAWSHNHFVALRQTGAANSANSVAQIAMGDGSFRTFLWDVPSATWKPTNSADSLTPNASGPLYRNLDDDDSYKFDPLGHLLTVTSRNGWVRSYSYSTASTPTAVAPVAGLLIGISNQFGRTLSLAYNSSSQLASVTTPDGQTTSYQYDGSTATSRLVRVNYPGAASKTYLYENTAFAPLLTGIVDENTNRLATYAYDVQGRGVSTQHAGGADQYAISYGPSVASPVLVTDPLGTQRSYTYATALGKLAVTGANLPAGAAGHDAASRVQNAMGLIDSETDFLGTITFFSWDANRRLKTAETRAAGRPEAQTTSTQWHPTFRLPALVTEPGKTTTYTYDSLGNKLSQTETDTTGGTTGGGGGAGGQGQTRIWAWAYNPQGLVSTATDPLGRVSSFGYDAAGNLASQTNALGQVSTFQYDGAGRITSSTAPSATGSGLQTSYAYDARGRLLQQTVGINVAAAQQETNIYTYLPSGQLASVQLPSGFKINYSYDAAQRLVGALDNRGNSITYTLDGMGNRVNEVVKDATGTIAWQTSRTINALNRVAALQSATFNTTTFGFDANGEPVATTDPLNQTTSQTLDALRRPKATSFADGASAQLAWNQLNQITQATDPKAVATTTTRNAWGEVLSESSPDSGTVTYTRNAVGNTSSKTDARGQTTSYQYDALNRVTQVNLADGKLQTFAYDGPSTGSGQAGTGAQTGYLRSFTDPSGSTSYERDAFGRITKKSQTVNDNPASPTTLTTQYAYTNGQLAQITYPSGLNIYYLRNTSGQITGIQSKAIPASYPRSPAIQTMVSGLTYTGLGQPKAWVWGGSAVPDSASRSFDTDGRMVGNEFASYTYDAAGRVSTVTQNLWVNRKFTDGTVTTSSLGQTSISWAIAYDNRNRVTGFNRVDSNPGVAASNQASYSYDVNGNRLGSSQQANPYADFNAEFSSVNLARNTQQSLAIAPGSNRLAGISQTATTTQNGTPLSTINSQITYQTDTAGNLLTDGLRKFDYDSDNRHNKTVISDSDEGSKATYLFNALGQRVFKSQPQVDHTAPNEAVLGSDFIAWLKLNFSWLFAPSSGPALLGTQYAYADAGANPGAPGSLGGGDGTLPAWALLGEYGNGAASATSRTEYVWLPQDDGSAIPIAMLGRFERFFPIHTDHLGTPRLIQFYSPLVANNWQLPYSAFGEAKPTGVLDAPMVANQAVSAPLLLKATVPWVALNLRFPGQYFDSETNLNYNYFRSYDPRTGRYSQPDPIGLGGGWNKYIYANQNPLMFTDPFGLLDSLHYDGRNLIGLDDAAIEFRVPATSGPYGKGRLPEGVYDANTLRRRTDPAMTCPDGSGWSLNLDPMFKTTRDLLRIHPDGNVTGTEGCIGPVCSEQKKVYDSLKRFFESNPGVKSLPLTVSYPK